MALEQIKKTKTKQNHKKQVYNIVFCKRITMYIRETERKKMITYSTAHKMKKQIG